MTTFMPERAAPDRAHPDHAKHVNYTYGMVLGVDDFTQEFAYLAGRDRWLARDLAGYGTLSGLRVRYEETYEGTDRGPRVSVSPGAAVTPSGQLVCVAPTQCAYLIEWLAAHHDDVLAKLIETSGTGDGEPPSTAMLHVDVACCYAECLTDKVPIPGEPCRSEDDLLAPSRVRDDFLLELRLDPLDEIEEEALQRFVVWMRQVPVTEDAPDDLNAFLDQIRLAAGFDGTTDCPPFEDFFPPPMLLAADEGDVAIPARLVDHYLRAAFRVWVTELLPCRRAAAPGCGCGCDPAATAAGADCVTLAHLAIHVRYDPVESRYVVGEDGVMVDEDYRPYLVNLRALREWMTLSARAAAQGAPSLMAATSAPATAPRVVAAGRFDASGELPGPPYFSYGGLRATPRDGSPGVFELALDGFDPADPAGYVVTGTVEVEEGAAAHVLEMVGPGPGLAVRIRRANASGVTMRGFMLQVTRFEGDGP